MSNTTKTIQEFTQELTEMVSSVLGIDRYKVSANTVKKINTELTAISIIDKEQDTNISPILYVNGFYHQYLNSDLEMEDICDALIKTYQENKIEDRFDVSFFSDWEQVKTRIVPRIINTEMNQVLLSEVPHMEFLDLAICFYVIVSMDEHGMGSILVRNEHMKMWNVSIEEITKQAFEANGVFQKATVQSMETVMRDIISDQLSRDGIEIAEDDLEGMLDALTETDSMMYVITNSDKQYGAIELMDVNLLENMAQKLDSDLCLILSSVHEIIAIKVDDRSAVDTYSAMIREVNESQVALNERLSDHPYYYAKGSRKVEIM